MRHVDLRSDTITKPTEAMRRAMARAEVGDDVFGEDPTVNRLQELAAERLGKEAALFVASGTMANLVCLLTHCGRGDEIILGDQSHTFVYEQGGYSALGSIHPQPVANLPDGTLPVEEIEAAIRADNVHFPRTRLICLENTHNRCYGAPLSVKYMAAVGELAAIHGLKVHVDGARIFNAAVAQGVPAQRLVEHADSVCFCLSKGLGAPVGSLVCGSRDFVEEARRARKVVGGGMRQAGIIAAAGIVALTEMVDRLEEDHANAKQLAKGLAEIEGLSIQPERVLTNIVYIDLVDERSEPNAVMERLNERGVQLLAPGPKRFRAVTTYHVSSADIDYVIEVFKKILAASN